MTLVEKLASFVVKSSFDDLSRGARDQLKIRVLDSLGCAIGALGGEPIRLIRDNIGDFGGTGHCTLIGGGRTSPDRAAFFNSALVRYLDFNDSFLASGETCHPSDNLGAVLAAAQYAGTSGRELLAALAVAYQVQCRLSEIAPVRDKGFDHTTQGAYAVAAGVSRALELNQKQTANAIAIAGTSLNALRVTRTGILSHWKGLAYPNMAFCATHAAFLARRGITGPLEVFEGNKGFMDAFGVRFKIDWLRQNLEKVTETILKEFNAEIHSQATIECVLSLKGEHHFTGADVKRIGIETFDVAYHIIGGGEEGGKTFVQTKEQADHSLPYLVAAAILDDQLMPEQYLPRRIKRGDVQRLLRKVTVKAVPAFSRMFPKQMPCRVTVHLKQGTILTKEQRDYEGFHTRPMSWQTVARKFQRLGKKFAGAALLDEISDATARLETIRAADLMRLLARVRAIPSKNKRRMKP